MVAKAKKTKPTEEEEAAMSAAFFKHRERPCGHELPVSDYLDMRGRQYGVGPQPHADHCTICDGVFTASQIEDKERWLYRVIHAMKFIHKKAVSDYEMALYRALRHRYAGQERG